LESLRGSLVWKGQGCWQWGEGKGEGKTAGTMNQKGNFVTKSAQKGRRNTVLSVGAKRGRSVLQESERGKKGGKELNKYAAEP